MNPTPATRCIRYTVYSGVMCLVKPACAPARRVLDNKRVEGEFGTLQEASWLRDCLRMADTEDLDYIISRTED